MLLCWLDDFVMQTLNYMEYRQRRELVCAGMWPCGVRSLSPFQPHLWRRWLLCSWPLPVCRWLRINARFVPCLCIREADQLLRDNPTICAAFVLALPQAVQDSSIPVNSNPTLAGQGFERPPNHLFCRQGKGCHSLPAFTACLWATLRNSRWWPIQRELSHLSVTTVTRLVPVFRVSRS